jgi:diketogulonate reductase-like aldo/keto reductase
VAIPGLPSVEIAPGVEMPLVGLGTWQATGARAHAAVLRALEVGYRLIDTATMYRNEREVGRALRESGVPREELFITTKLPSGNAGRERETIAASLEALGVDRLDLWLVHWPPGGHARPQTWERFVEARAEGLTRAIGVSNYDPGQIDEIVDATGVTPAVNQIRWSPALYDADLVAAHRQRGVALEGYSPFLSTDLGNRVLAEIAERHGATTRQVVVRWHVEHGFVVIPKSTDPGRIAANLDVLAFTLDDSEVARIDALGR